MGNVIKKLGLNAVKSYQKYISKDYNGSRHAHCMYTPSCSQYTLESIKENGFSKGVADGFFRLMRCNEDVRKMQFGQFFKMLAESDHNISLPDVVLENPKIKDVLMDLQEEVSYLKTARTPKENSIQQEEVKKVFQKIDLKTINAVGGKDKDIKFLLSLPHKDDSGKDSCKDDESIIYKVLENSAGLLSACGWGVAGGVTGFIVGVVLGASVSWAARNGGKENSRLDNLNNRLAEKYSAYSVIGMAKTEKSIGFISSRIEGFLEPYLHNKHIASAIASIIGVPYGVFAGVTGGTAKGGKVFGKMGYYFGRNLVHEKLHGTCK